jgi:arylsulfatase A-like enzyme
MHRRHFITSASLAAAAGELARGAQVPTAISERPNFLFLIADDLTYRSIHSLNNKEVDTPNLDRLVREGTCFTHCFHQGSWSAAVCVPSRVMLNSGLSAFHAQKLLDSVPLWGQTLGNAGYETYIAGKWHLDPTTLQRSFKQMGPIGPGMFESTPEAYHRPSPGNHWSPSDKSLKGHWLDTRLWLNAPDSEMRHSCSIWASEAAEHLTKVAPKQENPFFMYVGFNEPHDPRQSPREYLDKYPQARIEIPPNYLPEHPFDEGDHMIRDELLAPFPRTKEAVRLHRSEYYALISYLDHQVGVILAALERSGKAANTYVILTADHGLAVGQHGLMGKQNMYDHSIRMPLLISGPGVAKGKRIDELVYQHSLYATTCELAGVPVPSTVEFASLAGLLGGRQGKGQEAVFCYYKNFQRAVRTKEHKLIVYPEAAMVQLFDIVNDPWETRNLASDPKYASIKGDLMERLRQIRMELGDPLLRAHDNS